MKHLISFLIATSSLAACGQSTIIDWVDFVQFGGITYIAVDFGGSEVGRALTDGDLGPEFAKVRFKHAEQHIFGHECCRDGDAAFLEAGTPVYTVKGYQPKFRLAARRDGRLVLYEADTNPGAKTGADLLDIRGRVRAVAINSGEDGVTELGSISDPQQVAGLIELILEAPVDQKRQIEAGDLRSYFISLHLEDDTIVSRAYWPASGELQRGIMLPPEFQTAIEQILASGGQQAENLSPSELKYLLIEAFGGIGAYEGIFYCDSDGFPVVVAGQAEQRALEQFADIEKDAEAFQTILARINLLGTANFSTEQKTRIYQEYKKLLALGLERLGQNYQFQIAVQEDQTGSFNVEGRISPSGIITILKKEPAVIVGCPICLAGQTRIETPEGQIAVKDLRPGMTVWTSDAAGVRKPAIIVKTARVPVPLDHQMVQLQLDDGRQLLASAGHPTADGRLLGNLLPGDSLDGAHVLSAELIPYEETTTFDILPSGGTGSYWAEGILVGSTLAPDASSQAE